MTLANHALKSAQRDNLVLNSAIRVNNVSKLYKIYPRSSALLREVIMGTPTHSQHWALRNVSFDVPRGHVVGIVGPNGSGKSTLLKIVAGLLDATEGAVEVRGKISSILELGTGFHPDYTGRENIITGGMCLGMSRAEIEEKSEWIINFTELGSVIDQPFRTYSSGMQARLTFSTAISIDPDILIVDEALAAGDSYFVAKSFKRIREICSSGATVLFVSHGTNQVAQLCQSAVWLDQGIVREVGSARDVAKHYDYDQHVRISNNVGRMVEIEIDKADAPVISPAIVPTPALVFEISKVEPIQPIEPLTIPKLTVVAPVAPADSTALEVPIMPVLLPETVPETARLAPPSLDTIFTAAQVKSADPVSDNRSIAKVYRKGPIIIDRVVFLDGDGRPASVIRTWDTLQIDVHYHCDGEVPADTLGIGIGIERERDMVMIAQFNTVNLSGAEPLAYDEAPYRTRAGRRGVMRAVLPDLQMLEGEYLISLGLCPNIPGVSDFYEYHHRVYRLGVIPAGYPSGAVFYPKVEWIHEKSGDV